MIVTRRAGTSGKEVTDQRWMRLALRAARAGRPSPNPHVGAVVLDRRGNRVATGYHARAGQAHAEVMALSRAGALARGGTLYVTLEPCNHQGRTGPCTDVIIQAGIARVVFGCPDPTPHTRGSTRRLRRAGIEVCASVLEDECQALVASFSKHVCTGLPWVHIKAAVTLDGRMATRNGDSRWITGEASRKHVHRLRSQADAILVGIGTVLKDDPQLTVRHVRGQHPQPVVLDRALRIPESSKLVTQQGNRPLVVFHGRGAAPEKRQRLLKQGVELIQVATKRSRGGLGGTQTLGHGAELDLEKVLQTLGAMGIVHLLVEGGSRVFGSLLAEGWADWASIFVAPKILGDGQGIPLCEGFSGAKRPRLMSNAIALETANTRQMGNDVLFQGSVGNRLPWEDPLDGERSQR